MESKIFLRDFGSTIAKESDACTRFQLHAAVPPHPKGFQVGLSPGDSESCWITAMFKIPVWADLNFVTWCNILLQITMRRWSRWRHKLMSRQQWCSTVAEGFKQRSAGVKSWHTNNFTSSSPAGNIAKRQDNSNFYSNWIVQIYIEPKAFKVSIAKPFCSKKPSKCGACLTFCVHTLVCVGVRVLCSDSKCLRCYEVNNDR